MWQLIVLASPWARLDSGDHEVEEEEEIFLLYVGFLSLDGSFFYFVFRPPPLKDWYSSDIYKFCSG